MIVHLGNGYYLADNGKIATTNKFRKPTLLKQRLRKGYNRVYIDIGEGTKNYDVHRLVAKYFVPNPDNKPCVNHIDGDRLNNHHTNLEWCTVEENNRHSNTGKLNIEDVNKIRELLDHSPLSQREIAAMYDVHESTISDIKRGKRW